MIYLLVGRTQLSLPNPMSYYAAASGWSSAP
jgi:hypothetical protein